MRQYIGVVAIRFTDETVIHVDSTMPRWNWAAAYMDVREMVTTAVPKDREGDIALLTIQVRCYTDEGEPV